MIKALITDFSKVVLFHKDSSYIGKLNRLHEELLKESDYDIWEHFKLNDDLLSYYKVLSSSLDLYIFTTRYIQEYPPIKSRLEWIFEDVFISTDLWVKKDEKEAYLLLAEKLKLKPEEILFIDDTLGNIEAAKEAWFNTVRYENFKQAKSSIQNMINKN